MNHASLLENIGKLFKAENLESSIIENGDNYHDYNKNFENINYFHDENGENSIENCHNYHESDKNGMENCDNYHEDDKNGMKNCDNYHENDKKGMENCDSYHEDDKKGIENCDNYHENDTKRINNCDNYHENNSTDDDHANGEHFLKDKNINMKTILNHFNELYSEKLDQLEQDKQNSSPELVYEEKISIFESWVQNLIDQNELLVSTVQELEEEASRRVSMLQCHLNSTAEITRNTCINLSEHDNRIASLFRNEDFVLLNSQSIEKLKQFQSVAIENQKLIAENFELREQLLNNEISLSKMISETSDLKKLQLNNNMTLNEKDRTIAKLQCELSEIHHRLTVSQIEENNSIINGDFSDSESFHSLPLSRRSIGRSISSITSASTRPLSPPSEKSYSCETPNCSSILGKFDYSNVLKKYMSENGFQKPEFIVGGSTMVPELSGNRVNKSVFSTNISDECYDKTIDLCGLNNVEENFLSYHKKFCSLGTNFLEFQTKPKYNQKEVLNNCRNTICNNDNIDLPNNSNNDTPILIKAHNNEKTREKRSRNAIDEKTIQEYSKSETSILQNGNSNNCSSEDLEILDSIDHSTVESKLSRNIEAMAYRMKQLESKCKNLTVENQVLKKQKE